MKEENVFGHDDQTFCCGVNGVALATGGWSGGREGRELKPRGSCVCYCLRSCRTNGQKNARQNQNPSQHKGGMEEKKKVVSLL